MFWMEYHGAAEHENAVRGELDLRNWDFETNRPLSLNGEWEFYPYRHTLSFQDKPDYIQVPGNWKSSLSNDTPYGSGTYRLRIKVDPEHVQDYGIRVYRLQSIDLVCLVCKRPTVGAIRTAILVR
ncbi:hypothetical protein ACAF76_003755 [Brevibacillus sp. TJ4]|uniref:hypothetical protein n=1 Tax=Brevibacillus sp. TJ4 TaxID=3234853 RepID=UPI003B9E0C8A